MSKTNYGYNRIKKESKAYKYKCPEYEEYLLKKDFYDKYAKKRVLKYMKKLSKQYGIITTNDDGIYIPYIHIQSKL
jgi:predicted PP-loop superfamily ATPase